MKRKLNEDEESEATESPLMIKSKRRRMILDSDDEEGVCDVSDVAVETSGSGDVPGSGGIEPMVTQSPLANNEPVHTPPKRATGIDRGK